jgi:small conductance mechanosensitive channel
MQRPAIVLVSRIVPESEKLLDMGLRLGVTLAVAVLAQRLIVWLVGRAEKWMARAGRGDLHAVQRAHTLGLIFRHLGNVLVWSIAALRALDILGWDVKPILAGAGIVGVALGFGAQTLVRDLIAGFFVLAEDQFRVGDLIEVDGRTATVEAVTVRCTTLRDFNGFIHFVPNGELKTVVNRSRGWNRLSVDVPVASDEDLDRVLASCRQTVAELNAEPAWRERLLDPIEVWGLEALSGPEAQVRLVLRAQPGPDGPETARELRRRVLLALRQAGVRRVPRREIQIATLAGPGAST